MVVRRAVIGDVAGILEVIQPYVDDDTVLAVPVYELYERIRDFYVTEEDGVITGCGSLMIMWHDLAEVRSLVVRRGHQGVGIGRKIVEALIQEARTLGIASVFALTYQTIFFLRIGFQVVPKERLPHKVWKDCTYCAKFTHCDEIPVELVLIPESERDTDASHLPLPPDPNLLMPTPAD
ncbi:MAG: N-acetyltransferase [Gemmatimonadota bacterium]|nr:N-acetyltransferase [Gemmatimonadota bacterium]